MAPTKGWRNLSLSRGAAAAGVTVFGLTVAAACLLATWVMRQEAVHATSEKARLLLDCNLATHDYLNRELKPHVFDLAAGSRSPDYFDPTWMSSTYAVRQIEKYRRALSDDSYAYKECADNARSPGNEADPFERQFLQASMADSTLTVSVAVRDGDGAPYLEYLRRGEVMAAPCLRCHGEPGDAPAALRAQYGTERSFHRRVGELVSAVSIRVPLASAYANATPLFWRLLAALLGGFAALHALQFWVGKRLLFDPLRRLRDHARLIAADESYLGQTLDLPPGRELQDLTRAFNAMSASLHEDRDQLQRRVRQRTEDLERLAAQLRADVADRERLTQRLQQTTRRQQAMSRIRDQIFGLERLSEVEELLHTTWLEELRQLPLPVDAVWVQWANGTPGASDDRALAERQGKPDAWVGGSPVADAVQGGAARPHVPVALSGGGASAMALATDAATWLEVPLAGTDGLLRVRSAAAGALAGTDASDTLREFAGLLAVAWQRVGTLQALRLSEERFSKAFRTAPYAITITTLDDGELVEANDAAMRLSGYTPAQALGHSVASLGLWVDASDRDAVVQALRAGQSMVDQEYRFRSKTGDVFVGSLSAQILHLERGPCILASIADVTERTRTARALQEAQQWLLSEQTIRLAIASMAAPEQLGEVVAECSRQFQVLGGSEFESMALQVINDAGTDFISLGPGRPMGEHSLWVDGTAWSGSSEQVCRYPWVGQVWRDRQPRYERCSPIGGPMAAGMSVIDVPFSHGTLAISHCRSDAFTQGDVQLLGRLAEVVSDGFRRFTDLIQHRRAERQSAVAAALQRVRNEVLTMDSEGDWIRVAAVLSQELSNLVTCTDCAVNLIDVGGEDDGTVVVSGGLTYRSDRSWRQRPAVRRALETGLPVYRETRDDPLFNRRRPPEIHSVVDVPFSGGTLAVNSVHAHAFTAQDLDVLGQFAQVLTEAHRRLADVRQIENQRREAQAQLELDVALQRARNTVLAMEVPADWRGVAQRLRDELGGLIAFGACGINIVDLEQRTFTATLLTRDGSVEEARYSVLPRSLEQAMVSGQPVYRRNRGEMAASGESLQPGVGSVVDAPFAGGTLAINSEREAAFTARDIDILTRFAEVAAEAHRRVQDLAARQSMAAELERQWVKGLEASRLQTLGEMATGVAHELNQPLNGIRAFAEGGLYATAHGWEVAAAETDETFSEIIQLVDRMGAVISHMRELSRDTQASDPAGFSVAQVVEGAMALVAGELREHGLSPVITIPADLPWVAGHGSHIEQALLNLLGNAREALERRRESEGRVPGWRPQLLITAEADPQAGTVCLAVTDNGGGIAETVSGRVFDPFFTTKPVGKGTGLGLSVALSLVQQTGGNLTMANRPGHGVTFTIVLPAAPPAMGG